MIPAKNGSLMKKTTIEEAIEMQKITPHLWFDTEAKEAAALYTSLFPGSRIDSTVVLHDTPSGSVDIVNITVAGQAFTLLSAGPLLKFTPAISFLVACERKRSTGSGPSCRRAGRP
jgi:predicted 3-demethylubiquinone-9 3-methyltransferase (glyoxalase superfamily)